MDISKLVEQAKNMQKQVEDAQKSLENKEVIGKAGGDAVEFTITGKGTAKAVKISEAALSDKEMLEDLIVAAYNDAKTKADQISEEIMKDATAGVPLPPGLKI
jgi:hypothetical protein